MSSPLIEIADALSLYADLRSPVPARAERRAYVRLSPLDLPQPVHARLKHGPALTLLDVSAGGALVETAARLTPGAHLVLEFLAPDGEPTTTIGSRVLRSQVTSVDGEGLRYRGGCAFKQLLRLSGLELPAHEQARPILDAAALADAIGSLLSVARGSRDRQVTHLLDEIVRQVRVSESTQSLLAYVDDRLRKHVPLMSVSFTNVPRDSSTPGDCLSFDLGLGATDSRQRTHVEFRPACQLTEAQMRLLHAAASVMSLIHGWRSTSPSPAF